MPRKDEPVDDPIYNDLVAAGNDAVPCLIDLITDLRPMDDPRKAPHVVHFVVGDAAFFMLHEITGVPIESSLPKEVAANIDTEGVYAYFNFSHHPANREKIKQWWESWWQSRKRENRN